MRGYTALRPQEQLPRRGATGQGCRLDAALPSPRLPDRLGNSAEVGHETELIFSTGR